MVHPTLATAARPPASIAAVIAMSITTAVLIALALSWIGLGLGARSMPAPAPAPVAPAAVTAPPAPHAPAAAEPAAQPAGELMYVFRVGGETYMRLADLVDGDGHDAALAVPRHGRLRVLGDRGRGRGDDIVAAIAPVDDRDLPAELGAWRGRRARVDAGCIATVVGFAVVSRRVGRRRADVSRHAAARLVASGHTVLAARLDRCVGSFARDASAPGAPGDRP